MNSKNGFLTTMLLMAALVCFMAAPAMADKPWHEPPGHGAGGPGWDSETGNSGHATIDENPWIDDPPGAAAGGPSVNAVPGEGFGLRIWLLWLVGY